MSTIELTLGNSIIKVVGKFLLKKDVLIGMFIGSAITSAVFMTIHHNYFGKVYTNIQMSLKSHPSCHYYAGQTLYITGDSINLRQGPGLEEKSIGKLGKGQAVTFTGEKSSRLYCAPIQGEKIWALMFGVDTDKGSGYVFGGFLTNIRPAVANTTHPAEPRPDTYDDYDKLRSDTLISLGENINIRSEPSLKGDILDKLDKDELVVLENVSENKERILACENKEEQHWYYVQSISNPGKQKGWVYGGCVAHHTEAFSYDMFSLSD